MSKNVKKITKALENKGYRTINIMWEPIRRGSEMCGPEGGWYIDYGIFSEPDDDTAYIGLILAYSTVEALEEIENLEPAKEQEAPHE